LRRPQLVDELVVECPNREEGCQYTAQRQLVEEHLRRDCLFVLVACEAEGCDKTRRKKDTGKGCVHDLTADANDETRPSSSNVICDFCGDSVVRSDRDQHADSCPEAIICCRQSVHGCSWTGRRVLLEAHTLSCPYESIRPFFVSNSARLSELSEENNMLRHKVDAMEGIIRSMQRELQTIGAALGPWYRPEGVLQSMLYRSSLSNEQQLLSDTDSYSATGLGFGDSSTAVMPNAPNYPHPPVSAASPPIMPLNTSSSASSLADYFPPEDLSITARPGSVRVHHSLQSFSAHHFPDHSGVNPPNANRSSLIAPLNLSTSLEGTLTGLRESLVTLSAALESQGRRQELALTTEGLRLNEEVGSLKAVVHGLRMQVHAIMMDRNAQVTGRLPFGGGGNGGVVPGLGSQGGDYSWPEGTGSSGYSASGVGSAGFSPVSSPPALAPGGRFGHHHQYYSAQPTTSITKL